MDKNLFAFTAAGSEFPGFVSINQSESGDVTVTVRAASTIRDGVYVCAHKGEEAPGRCTPGGPTCNNYCNMAPEKGPMQDQPLGCRHVDPGQMTSLTINADEWHGFPKGE